MPFGARLTNWRDVRQWGSVERTALDALIRAHRPNHAGDSIQGPCPPPLSAGPICAEGGVAEG